MSTPILATKLYIPPLRPHVVSRPRLLERLNEGLHRNLTLISAPAGFGKTTLVSEWLAGCQRPTAWLSLGEGENDSTRFLTYLVAALQTHESFTLLRPLSGMCVITGFQNLTFAHFLTSRKRILHHLGIQNCITFIKYVFCLLQIF